MLRSLTNEVAALLKSGGRWYIAEPVFHVSKKEFPEVIERGKANGLTVLEQSGLLSRVVVFRK